MTKQVIITIGADGKMQANLSGYQGKECDQERLLVELQKLLEPSTASEQKKPEYYQEQHIEVQQR